MFETLLVIGTLFLAYGCRSFEFVAVRKFGAFCVIIATFLTGYFLSGHNIMWGIVTALGWFFLPGIDIMTRIRRMRLPLDKKMQSRFPPNRDIFPQLREQFSASLKEHLQKFKKTAWQTRAGRGHQEVWARKLLRILSWNVNGIPKAQLGNFLDALTSLVPWDVLLLQEMNIHL